MSETFIQQTIRQHKELREEWVNAGCPKQFSEWLLDRVEARLEKSTERGRA